MSDDASRANHWLSALVEAEVALGVEGRGGGLRQRQAVSLAAYEMSFSVSAAARGAGVGRQTVHRWKSEDPVFASAWKDAELAVRDDVVAAVYDRALHGVEVAIRDRYGAVVGHEKRPSDRLLLALLRGLDPTRFGERRGDVSVPDTGWRQPLVGILQDPDARAHLEALADHLGNN